MRRLRLSSAAIRRRLNYLCERPELGQVFEYRRPGLRRLHSGRRVIFYRFDDERVQVVRILHDAMDFERRLGPA